LIHASRNVVANHCGVLLTGVFQQMGLPISRLICASNQNNVLSELINTGQYNAASRGPKAIPTISPAIDITRASNFERYFHHAVGRNGHLVSRAYRDLENTGRFCLPPQVCSSLYTVSKQVPKLLWTRKGVRATVVTAGHCMHAELTSGSGHALASAYSCCVHSRGLC